MTFRRVFSYLKESRKKYGGFLKKAFSKKYLFYTNVFLSTSISTVGDLLEQSREVLTHEIDDYEYSRTAHMAFSGSVSGIICHNWYNILDKIIIGRSVDMVIKKVLLDQFICSPIVILSFFATVAIFEDDPWTNFSEEVSEKFWTLYKAEWIVWPPAQVINFYVMPLRFRILYDNIISLAYDVYTSQVKHSKTKKDENKDKTESNESDISQNQDNKHSE